MVEPPARAESFWEGIRGHSIVRAAVVFGSAVFFVLQLLDVLGLPSSVIRWLAVLAAAGFVAGEGVLVWRARRPQGTAAAPIRLRGWLVGGRRWLFAAALLLVLGAAAWVVGRRLIGSPVHPGTDVIAVMPFVASGVGVEDLAIGMVSLMTANLDQVGGIRTIDAGTVLHGWTRRADGGMVDLQGALELGRAVGAGAILWGSVAAVRDAVQVTGEIYTVDGVRVASGRERGDVDELHTLVDRLSVDLLREIWRASAPLPDLRIAAITTESPVALRAFVRGERHLRAARYDSAVALLEEAVRIDSTFALAHFRLSEAYGWSTHIGSEPTVRASEAANRFSARLPERERSIAAAHLLHEHGDFAALDSLRAITRRYPDDALAWYLLGDILYHTGPFLQPPNDELTAPFRRAVELDPTPSGGMIHMLDLGLFTDDRALFDEFLAHYRSAAGADLARRWERLASVRWGPADSVLERAAVVAREFLEERVPGTYMGRLRGLVGTRFATEMELDPARLIEFAERASTLVPAATLQAMNQRADALVDAGRIREASVLLDSLGPDPLLGAPPPALRRIIMSVTGLYPADSVGAQFDRLARDSAFHGEIPLLRRVFHLGQGDAGGAEAIPLPPLPSDTAAAFRAQAGLRMAVEAWAMQVRGDTARAISLMRDAIRTGGYGLDFLLPMYSAGPLFIHAVALSRRADTRAEGLRRLRTYLGFGSGFTVLSYLAIAEALEAEGDAAGAAEAYAHVVRLWRDADPHLQPHVAGARAALARLTGERVGPDAFR